MIVPAIPQPLTEEEIAGLRPGDMHHVDSGMGGSFPVKFVGREGDDYVFENCAAEWRMWGPYRYTAEDVRDKVYRLVAENPFFRDKTIDR